MALSVSDDVIARARELDSVVLHFTHGFVRKGGFATRGYSFVSDVHLAKEIARAWVRDQQEKYPIDWAGLWSTFLQEKFGPGYQQSCDQWTSTRSCYEPPDQDWLQSLHLKDFHQKAEEWLDDYNNNTISVYMYDPKKSQDYFVCTKDLICISYEPPLERIINVESYGR